jgi:hypothetical protein
MLNHVLIIGIGMAALLAGISGAWSPCGFAMIETFTPHMCGSQRRRTMGVALFAIGAIAASAALGAALGFVGHGLPATWTFTLLGILALVGAARDLGIVRIPLPQRRGQVPESWRRHLPLAVWAPAYGIMLGLGVLTFQVVSTFWVVAGASIALGSPATAASCFALFGVGRVLMVIVPPARATSFSVAAVGIGPVMPVIRRLNGLLLCGVGVLALACSPALGASSSTGGPIGGYQPVVISGTSYGYVHGDGNGGHNVIIKNHTVYGATSPSIAGNLAAIVCAANTSPCAGTSGVAVVDWTTWNLIVPPCPPPPPPPPTTTPTTTTTTTTPTTSTPNPPCPSPTYPPAKYPVIAHAVRPSLSPNGRLLAYVISNSGGETLYLTKFSGTTRTTRSIYHVPYLDDISGPTLSNSTLAWAVNHGLPGSSIMVMNVPTGRRRTITTSIGNTDLTSPSIYNGRIGWIIQDGTTSYRSTIMVSSLNGAGQRAIYTLRSPTQILWGLSLGSHVALTTKWKVFATTNGGAQQPIGTIVSRKF